MVENQETVDTETSEEALEEEMVETESKQSVRIGLHPLGGLQFTVTDRQGDTATARISVDEVWILQGQLTALTSMVVQGALMANAQAEQEAASLRSKIVRP